MTSGPRSRIDQIEPPEPQPRETLGTNPRVERRGILLAALILSVHTLLLAHSAWVHSPTYNEPAHLVAGVGLWQSARFDLYRVNPPLPRLVAAAPVVLAGCRTDWEHFRDGPGERPEMALGTAFCDANGPRIFRLVTLARWACLPFSVLGGVVCFVWARALHGPRAGLLALTLWAICPNILAHGALATCDMAATAFGALAGFTFWRWLRSATASRAALFGVALGLADSCKTTWLVLSLLFPVLWVVDRLVGGVRPAWREFLSLSAALALSLYVLNMTYAFEGAFTPLDEFRFVSRSLSGRTLPSSGTAGGNRFSGSWLGRIPVPLPRDFVLGIDLQRKDFEAYGHDSYLNGVWSRSGWWSYYVRALSMKVPLGMGLVVVAAGLARLSRSHPARLRDDLVVLAPAACVLVLVSAQTGMNEHLRYVLPAFPFVFVWAGGAGAQAVDPDRLRSTIVPGLTVLGLGWATLSSLACHPHSLAYFNEAAGGIDQGWTHLAGSNLDWGQDLLFLRRWLDTHPEAQPLRIALYGTVPPRLAGIEARTIPWDDELPPGYFAVSATVRAGFGRPRHTPAARQFEKLRPVDRVGGSIFIYAVPEQPADGDRRVP